MVLRVKSSDLSISGVEFHLESVKKCGTIALN